MIYDKLLVLDLDETLIHTNETGVTHNNAKQDFLISEGYSVSIRPGLENFLYYCFSSFKETMIWTAATNDYAYEVLMKITQIPNFVRIWDRSRCSYKRDMEKLEDYWIKDISKLSRIGYDKKKILCIDDTRRNYEKSYGNLVPIKPFYGDPEDQELVYLQKYLDILGQAENIRSINKNVWRSTIHISNK
jgi:TFIIF-interacting CTD phosphatase-like protein